MNHCWSSLVLLQNVKWSAVFTCSMYCRYSRHILPACLTPFFFFFFSIWCTSFISWYWMIGKAQDFFTKWKDCCQSTKWLQLGTLHRICYQCSVMLIHSCSIFSNGAGKLCGYGAQFARSWKFDSGSWWLLAEQRGGLF